MKILVEESALESLKAMVEQLQSERDELLDIVKKSRTFVAFAYSKKIVGADCVGYDIDAIIAKCTAKPEVLE